MKKIKIRDLTLCDEREPLSLSRLSVDSLERLLPLYRDAHFHILEVWREGLSEIDVHQIDKKERERLGACSRELRGVSLMAILSEAHTILGNNSRPTSELDRACQTAFDCGLDIIRFSDRENDTETIRRTIRKVSELGGVPDCAICYLCETETVQDVILQEKKGFLKRLFGSSSPVRIEPEKKFPDSYFVEKALLAEKEGAKIVTLEDSGDLLTPSRLFALMPKLKIALKVPVDFYCPTLRPGYSLALALTAIIKGVDIIDTSVWGYGGPLGGPAIELIDIFCRKMEIELDVDIKAVGKLRHEMSVIGAMLPGAPVVKSSDNLPARIWIDDFEELYNNMPREIEEAFDVAIRAAGENDEAHLLENCLKIETYFGFA